MALLYLAAKPAHVGIDVDGLACPTVLSYGLQPLDEGIGPPARCCLVPLLKSGGGASLWDVKPPDSDFWWSTDCAVGTCAAKSYME
jgi:hypothetical protein